MWLGNEVGLTADHRKQRIDIHSFIRNSEEQYAEGCLEIMRVCSITLEHLHHYLLQYQSTRRECATDIKGRLRGTDPNATLREPRNLDPMSPKNLEAMAPSKPRVIAIYEQASIWQVLRKCISQSRVRTMAVFP